MCICTNSTHQFSKEKATTKQKQRKLNAKREPTTIHIQNPRKTHRRHPETRRNGKSSTTETYNNNMSKKINALFCPQKLQKRTKKDTAKTQNTTLTYLNWEARAKQCARVYKRARRLNTHGQELIAVLANTTSNRSEKIRHQ